MNRRGLFIRTDHNLSSHGMCFLSSKSAGTACTRGIGFSIASDRIAGYRHANRSPSKAVTSGDSQAQPSSPPAFGGVALGLQLLSVVLPMSSSLTLRESRRWVARMISWTASYDS
jgi:hypothetical protein